MNQEKIGKFIKDCRKKKKLTQEELARLLNVTDKAISKWENGRCLPDVSLFEKLCKELDITVNELLSGEKLNENNYQEKTEKLALNLLDNMKKSKRIYLKIILIIIVLFCITILLLNKISNIEFNVPYDSRIMKCDIDDNELTFKILGLSTLNTHYTLIKNDTEEIYFFSTKIYLVNKQQSHFESWDSMAKRINGQKESFGYQHILNIDTNKTIKVYHTNISLDKIKKANKKELEKIIKKSNLMCEKE